jgi:hypothetical protein|tara:strand:- start:1299 stop:1463 length:165 start_codon:yes stop_codon:yes gene_type:complete
MTVTTEDGNRQNIFGKEPRMEVVDNDHVVGLLSFAVLAGGLVGFVFLISKLGLI